MAEHPPLHVYEHDSPRDTLLPLLPLTLPLVRRIQFHFQSPDAHVLCTLPPDYIQRPNHPPSSFSAAYVDRSRNPETECWIWSSIELPLPLHDPGLAGTLLSQAKDQLLAILCHISNLPTPPFFPQSSSKTLLLVGSLHRRVLEILKEAPAGGQGKKVISGPSAATNGDRNTQDGDHGGCISGHTTPITKWLIAPQSASDDAASSVDKLPETLSWSTVRPEEYELVASKTDIPRKARTLKLLPSVAIRYGGVEEGSIIAWGFLGPDGSLTTLHTEPEFRGKGLAKKVAWKLFGLLQSHDEDGGAEVEGQEAGFVGVRKGQEWNQSDIVGPNPASEGVAKGLGGKEGWECFWCWVDLEKAGLMGKGV